MTRLCRSIVILLCLTAFSLASPAAHAAQGEGNAKFQEFLKRANAGEANAIFAVGHRYDRGLDDVAKNPEEAIKWFRRAAAQGHLVAQAVLSNRLAARGELDDACMWAIVASGQGHENAQKQLTLLERRLSPAALAKARERAAAFSAQFGIPGATSAPSGSAVAKAPSNYKADTSDCPPPLDPAEPLPVLDKITVGGVSLNTARLPGGLKLDPVLGVVAASPLNGQVIHRTQARILETRGLKTPGGDFLVMFPEGDHYANNKGITRKNNKLLAYRSTDKGRTWKGPVEAFNGIDYSQHGFIPFVPKNSKRIYAFGTQPDPDAGYDSTPGKQENAPIGYRYSDDDGITWSHPNYIRPLNDPGFKGMAVIRMTETDAGTWLLGAHVAHWSYRPTIIVTEQYILRSTDKGSTWELLPGKRPEGWTNGPERRLEETRYINLNNGGEILSMSRTMAGSLFTARSRDDGKTWTTAAPTTLVHSGAPPMLFHLSDNKTLIAFHHNRLPVKPDGKDAASGLADHSENMKVRSELWFSLSTDHGKTWSPSRFVLAIATQPKAGIPQAWNFQASYLDMFIDDGVLHLILPHRWQQVLHLTLPESTLQTLPTREQLQRMAR